MPLNLVAKIKFYILLYIIIWLLMAILLWLYLIPVWFDVILIVSCSWKKLYHIATNVCSRKSDTNFGDLPVWLGHITIVENCCYMGRLFDSWQTHSRYEVNRWRHGSPWWSLSCVLLHNSQHTHRQILLFQIKLVKNFMLNDNRFVKTTKFIYKFLNVTIILWINTSVVFCVSVLHIKFKVNMIYSNEEGSG